RCFRRPGLFRADSPGGDKQSRCLDQGAGGAGLPGITLGGQLRAGPPSGVRRCGTGRRPAGTTGDSAALPAAAYRAIPADYRGYAGAESGTPAGARYAGRLRGAAPHQEPKVGRTPTSAVKLMGSPLRSTSSSTVEPGLARAT